MQTQGMKKLQYVGPIALISTLGGSLVGCGSSDQQNATLSIRLSSGASSSQSSNQVIAQRVSRVAQAARYGNDDLKSYKVYVPFITLTRKYMSDGSVAQGKPLFGSYPSAQSLGYPDSIQLAKDSKFSSWIDLANSSSVSSFLKDNKFTWTPDTYEGISMAFGNVVQVDANLTQSGNTYKTCGDTDTQISGEQATVSNLTSCTQGLTTISMKKNSNGEGGGLPHSVRDFKFLKPVTLGAKKTYALDLVFRPGNWIKTSGEPSAQPPYKDNGGNKLYFSTPDVIPILRESSQTTYRESYSIPGVNGCDYLVDLYYLGSSSDVGKADVVGAQIKKFPSTGSAANCNDASVASVKSDNGALSLLDSNSTPQISNLTRTTSDSAGSSIGNVAISGSSYAATFEGLTKL